MFNIHTYHITDSEPCLLNADPSTLQPSYPSQVALSVGLHPWQVATDWQETFSSVCVAAERTDVWAIGECGLDKVKAGASLSVQMEALRAHIALAERVQKPMIIHCVRAFDELLALRKEAEDSAKRVGRLPQPWVVHGFRGKPEQAQQIMAKGLLLSFGHHYNVDALRFVYASFDSSSPSLSGSSLWEGQGSLNPFFLETDDLPFSVRQIYEQVARHLDVDVARLARLCDPRQTIFSPHLSSR